MLPFTSGAISILLGWGVSKVEPDPGSWLGFLAFQGSASQARDVVMAIAGTMVTVMALVLGLSVVALLTSSTQFSPRLLRNFLRDRQNQLVLSVFMGTFCYSAAGLYTVGVGDDPEHFPRLEAQLILADADREIRQPADCVPVRRATDALLRRIAAYRSQAE